MAHLRIHNARYLRNLEDRDFFKIRSFTRGVKVTINLNSRRGRKSKVIKDLVKDVGEAEFEKDGQYTTVAVSVFRPPLKYS